MINSFFVTMSFSIFCSGIIVFVLIELMIVEVPKSPVSKGRRGCWRFRLNVEIPRNPARRKISVAFIFSFSGMIKRIEIQIRKKPSILSMKG